MRGAQGDQLGMAQAAAPLACRSARLARSPARHPLWRRSTAPRSQSASLAVARGAPGPTPTGLPSAHERPPRVLLTEPRPLPPPWSPVDPAGTPTRPVRPVGQGLAGPLTTATYATLAHRDGVGCEANTASLSRSPGLRSHTAGVESTPCSSGRAVNQSPTGWRRVGAGRRPIASGQMQRAPPAGKASCLGPSPDRTRP